MACNEWNALFAFTLPLTIAVLALAASLAAVLALAIAVLALTAASTAAFLPLISHCRSFRFTRTNGGGPP
jgi:uncharacterized membrane protein YdjX (TVP38/TMEM64 family)